jgi:hypothetical protein
MLNTRPHGPRNQPGFLSKKIERETQLRARIRCVMRCCEGCVFYTGLGLRIAREAVLGDFDRFFAVEFFAF